MNRIGVWKIWPEPSQGQAEGKIYKKQATSSIKEW